MIRTGRSNPIYSSAFPGSSSISCNVARAPQSLPLYSMGDDVGRKEAVAKDVVSRGGWSRSNADEISFGEC